VDGGPATIWTIAQLVPGGEGLARLPDGRIGFARGVAPGDSIRVLALAERRGYLRAARWELLEPSPERAEPPCPVADRCGGCDWMHLERGAQLRAKAALLGEALRRTGGVRELPGPLGVVTAGPHLGYRSRLRLHVDGAGHIGLFAHGSHELVEIPGCPVSAPEIDAALAELRRIGVESGLGPGASCDLEIRVAPGGPRLSVHVLSRERPRIRPNAAWLGTLQQRWCTSLPGESYDAGKEQRWPLPGGVELRAPPQAFTQVNWPVNLAIVSALVEGARERGVKRFCDLYCGAGNFALALLAAGLEGVGVDRAGTGIRAAAPQ
jgi:23S rRNA (uracil1939-C5)-methyltransferase